MSNKKVVRPAGQDMVFDMISQAINIDDIIRRYKKLKSDRDSNVLGMWESIRRHTGGRNRSFNNAVRPLYNNTSSNSAMPNYSSIVSGKINKIIALLCSQLCDPSVKWLGLEFSEVTFLPNGEMKNFGESDVAKDWLDTVKKTLYSVFANPASNFYVAGHEVTFDEFTIGTACDCIIWREDVSEIRFSSVSMRDIIVDLNAYGEISDTYRILRKSFRDAYSLWGDALHQNELRKLNSKSETEGDSTREYVEVIINNPIYGSGFPTGRFLEAVIDIEHKHLVKIGFHKVRPYVVSRFFTSPGDIYGTSPVWNSMPDIMRINWLNQRTMQGVDYMTAPPLMVRDSTSINQHQLMPNKLVNGLDESGRPMIQPLSLNNSIMFMVDYYDKITNELEESLLSKDVFAQEGPNMTATEITERKIQASNRLRPILVRLEQERLNPIIRRTISILGDMGKLPAFPYESLKISPELLPDPYSQIRINYSGQMARMQKMQDIQNNDIIFNKAISAAQVSPEVFDRINIDRLIVNDAEILGVSSEVIVPDAGVQQIREMRAAQEQQRQQMELQAQEINNTIRIKEAGLDEDEY